MSTLWGTDHLLREQDSKLTASVHLSHSFSFQSSEYAQDLRILTQAVQTACSPSHKKTPVGTFYFWLDMVAEIGTFWKLDPLAAYLPNLKDGLYPVVRPTTIELANIKQGFFGITQPTEKEMAEYR